MMGHLDDAFEQAKRENNPVEQARLAGKLINIYQQRATELARLRKEAINRAVTESGSTYSSVAQQIGLTRARVAQIRKQAPPAHRALFGVGPMTIAAPLRELGGRSTPVMAAEDVRAVEDLSDYLSSLSLVIERRDIPPSGDWDPPAETIAICGPKSSQVTAYALENDPCLQFQEDSSGRWGISDKNGTNFISPMDAEEGAANSDIAYVGKVPVNDMDLFIIAGVHAIGSLGAVHYLARNSGELYSSVGVKRFSMVIGSDFDETRRTIRSYPVCPPQIHR